MKTLELLLQSRFDYAGMFPPAKLSLEEALREAINLRDTLARPHLLAAEFVVDSNRLAEIHEAYLEELGYDRLTPFQLVVLPPDYEGSLAALRSEFRLLAERIEHFELDGGLIQLRSIELKTSLAIGNLLEQLPAIDGIFEELFPDTIPTLTFEVNADSFAEGNSIDQTLATLDAHNSKRVARCGLKFRCSGEESISREMLTLLIDHWRRSEVPLKLTAGLHHPIVENTYNNVFGFLNITAAILLSRAISRDAFPRSLITECLETDSATAFDFRSGLWWKNSAVDFATVEKLLGKLSLRFGSCSLTEPDSDLQRLFGTPSGRDLP